MARKKKGFKQWYQGQAMGAPEGFALSKKDKQGLKKQWKQGDKKGAKTAYADMVTGYQPAPAEDPSMGIQPVPAFEDPAKLSDMLADPMKSGARDPIYGQVNENLLGLFGQASQNQSKPFDMAQFGPSITADQFQGQAQQVQDSIYDQNKTLIDEDFNERRERMSQELSMKGIPVGSEAHMKEMDRFDKNYQSQLTSARQSAIQAGTQEQQRLYDNAVASRQRQISEALTQRGMPMQEANQYAQYFGQQGQESAQQSLFDQQSKMLGQGQQYDLEKMKTQHGYDQSMAKLQGKIAASMPRGGGGGSGYDPMALANLKHSQAKELLQLGQAHQLIMQQNQPDGSQSGKNSATNAAIAGGTAAILGG